MEGKQGLFSKIAHWGPGRWIAESIRNKLMVTILALALIPLGLLGYIAITQSKAVLLSQAFDSLKTAQARRLQQIPAWFTRMQDEMEVFAASPLTKAAAEELYQALAETGRGNVTQGAMVVRQLYFNQPELVDAQDGSAYSRAHAKYQKYFSFYKEKFAVSSIYFVADEGTIFYNTDKGEHFCDNLFAKKNVTSRLLKLLDQAQKGKKAGALYRSEFGFSEATGNITAYFFMPLGTGEDAAPARDTMSPATLSGEGMGSGTLPSAEPQKALAKYLVFEMTLEGLNKIMASVVGLGQTGEDYLVGPDALMRTDSRFLEELKVKSTIMNPDFKFTEHQGFKKAMAGESGEGIIPDYRGKQVLSVWAPLEIEPPSELYPNGVTWAILTEMDEVEVLQVPNALRRNLLIIMGSAFVVTIGASLLLSKNLVQQIRKIMTLFSEIGMGDFDARVAVVSRDELGTMASSLNAMLDSTLALIQSREERDKIQSSIMRLLDEVSGLADGDLTVEAEVTADATGALADAYNFMIVQLREIISNVQDATLHVSSSANEIQTTAEHLAQGSETQAMQITDTSAAIDEMAVSIQQVSENAALSATVGDQAKANAQKGTRAVQDTIEGMNRIRDQVQETAKRIKRLGESSQEVGEIVQLIGDIADRTSILALNASIQAAMAGEAGRGFAVVAEEVERLAERSTSATKQIESLIKTIQSETNEAMAAMEATTNEVVSGTHLSDQAGQALGEIESVSSRLAELIQSISLAAKQQARGSEALSGSMIEIAEVTQQTAAGTKQAAVSINNLAALADSLRESVSRFKLPG